VTKAQDFSIVALSSLLSIMQLYVLSQSDLLVGCYLIHAVKKRRLNIIIDGQ